MLIMNTLYSQKKVVGFGHRIFSLSEVYWKLDEAAILDPKFRSALSKSLDEQGMLWPPIVWDQNTFLLYLKESGNRHDPSKDIEITKTYRVAIGNNRFEYAREKGYTHIECVIAEDWKDRETILAQTEMRYYEDF